MYSKIGLRAEDVVVSIVADTTSGPDYVRFYQNSGTIEFFSILTATFQYIRRAVGIARMDLPSTLDNGEPKLWIIKALRSEYEGLGLVEAKWIVEWFLANFELHAGQK